MTMKWPSAAGRYYTGNENSCVAVCTLASIDLLEKFKDSEHLDKISIVGKAVTENIGIEKIVQNIVANPNIRFLILCGQESHGHCVGQAITCLIESGVDEEGKIIGARGPMPTVKNLTKEQIENFKNQVEIVDLIGCEDIDKILEHVNMCHGKKLGKFESEIKTEEIKPIEAYHDEMKDVALDPKGFFIILLDRDNGEIVVEHYTAEWDEEAMKKYSGNWGACMKSQKLNKIIRGKTAAEISHTIVREGLVSRLEHAAYLGRELQRAEKALKENLPYEQDS
jgi:tetrahydromethanopterin S-methyltransferase subunit A